MRRCARRWLTSSMAPRRRCRPAAGWSARTTAPGACSAGCLRATSTSGTSARTGALGLTCRPSCAGSSSPGRPGRLRHAAGRQATGPGLGYELEGEVPRGRRAAVEVLLEGAQATVLDADRLALHLARAVAALVDQHLEHASAADARQVAGLRLFPVPVVRLAGDARSRRQGASTSRQSESSNRRVIQVSRGQARCPSPGTGSIRAWQSWQVPLRQRLQTEALGR